jgi:DNA-binding NarL/FixJ family response regulator
MRDPGTMSVRCVIVDDNRHFLRAARDLLERAGITVVGVAQTGAQAGRACGELEPDVVLVDVDLGEESGFDVARQLAGQGGPEQPCVILISAHSAEDFREMVADTPAISFLPKSALSGSAVLGIMAGAGGPASLRPYRDSR